MRKSCIILLPLVYGDKEQCQIHPKWLLFKREEKRTGLMCVIIKKYPFMNSKTFLHFLGINFIASSKVPEVCDYYMWDYCAQRPV